ncbi:MAG: hypothetical protein ACFCVK_16425, partial [Acidimicrobiales bacterium]
MALRGRGLRFVLVGELMATGEVTVAELVEAVTAAGYALAGRASKVISDALRWEVRRGRVVRLGRGRYAMGRVPATTRRRIRIFAARCHAWIVAVRRQKDPPPTPPDLRITWLRHPHRPHDPPPHQPPWRHLGWLWV